MVFFPRAAYIALLSALPLLVNGHGYIASPRSRNFVAYEDGVWWPVNPDGPFPESEPQSANRGGVNARCGIIAGRDYDYPPNHGGGIMAWNEQACYQPGSVVEFDSVMTAHHWGHFEFKACPVSADDPVADQSCFDANPLTFLEDIVPAGQSRFPANVDPLYPARAYIPSAGAGGMRYKHKYQLPSNLSGETVLLQWYYMTANSCSGPGYDTYNFPDEVQFPHHGSECPTIPPDGIGTPEQFWNCAEIRISNDCATSPTTQAPPGTTTTSATGTTITGATATTQATTVNSPPPPAPNPNCPNSMGTCGAGTTCDSLGFTGMCCSQWGYCGNGADYCGTCCQNGPCEGGPVSPPTNPPPSPSPPTPTPPTPPTTPGFNYSADHGEDSRMIAYVGNWQACPTAEQVDAYSHIVIAFAVSYTWSPSKNNCDETCSLAAEVPICNNMNNQALVNTWRDAGKKVILSFGGAGMGGSWSGDQNNCWDYCFGREEELSTSLVNIISAQNFDGIDIDYEYCYDVDGAPGIPGKQAGRCSQRTAAYTDSNAQRFLDSLTWKLRTKLDALQFVNGYDRGRYEITHAPMDSDLTPTTSAYFQILHSRRADLDFLMPQFYNGVTRPMSTDGVDGSGVGQYSAASMFGSLANEMFDSEPNKVVFGHCISDCSGTGSNANADQALQITTDLKTVNNGEYACNGGAFFWVAVHDSGGAWSDRVVAEVSKTAGCSRVSSPSTTTDATTTTVPDTTTTATTTTATTTDATTTTVPDTTTTATTTDATTTTVPDTTTTATTTTATTTDATTTTVPDTTTTSTTTEVTTTNATTTTVPDTTTTSTTTEVTTTNATTTTVPDTTTTSTTTEVTTTDATTTTVPDTTTTSTTTDATTTTVPDTTTTDTTTDATTTTTSTTTTTFGEPVIDSTAARCGTSELDAREHCRPACTHNGDCQSGQWCWGVHRSYCGSIPQRTYTNPIQSNVWTRCGKSEIDARTFCGEPCTWQCSTPGETCVSVNSNYCGSDYTTDEPVTTTEATTTTTTTTTFGEPVIDTQHRCGTSELDAREHCRPTCTHNGDCQSGQWCFGVHANYCGSVPQRSYTNPIQSNVWTRCGKSEIDARTFCGEPCTWQCSTPGETCVGIHSNYCGSDYTEAA